METEKKQKSPMLWYWSMPENGMEIEDYEQIAKENTSAHKSGNRYMGMYIAFV